MAAILFAGAATPTAQDNYLRDLLVADGHTVTFHNSATNLPSMTGYNAVVLSQSSANGDLSAADCNTVTVGVVYLEYTYDVIRMTSVAGTTAPGTSTQHDVTTAGNSHPIYSGLSDPMSWHSSGGSPFSALVSNLASGATLLATWSEFTTIIACAVADAGATLTSGTAPGRRVVTNIATGSSAYTGWTTSTQTLFKNMVNWAAAPPSLTPPTGLAGNAVSGTQINLTWNAVAGASGYDVERNGSVIASGVAAVSYSDTGLTPNTQYTYRVRAVGS